MSILVIFRRDHKTTALQGHLEIISTEQRFNKVKRLL